LADLERWDPGSIRAVGAAATKRANDCRDIAHNQAATIQSLEWQGFSREAAMAVAQKISADMLHHADDCDAAAKKVNDAASEVESIKAEWSRIQHMADRWGITIDSGSGMLHPPHSTDADEQAVIEHHMQIIHDAIVDLLRKADSTDQHLSESVNSAISDMADALGTDSITDPEDARRTVQEALAGNQDSAAQVKSVLDSITPEQRAGKEPLTQQQASVLSQMQAQQNGMSIPELEAAEQGMGASKGAMSDSWQLMSNPNIAFPQTPTVPGASQTGKINPGGFGQLPTAVQNTLNSKGMSQLGEMTKLTNIVKDGNVGLRQGGTALDRGMLNKATEMMNAPTFHGQAAPGSRGGTYDVANSGVQTANDVLATAGGDHQAVHDILRDGQYSDNFMKGSLNTDWGDNGKAVGDMFRWTGDAANGTDARMAAETASAYGKYIGIHGADGSLLHMGDQTLGQLNPEAVRGLSHGLAPYIPDIAGTSDASHPGFDTPDVADDQGNRQLPLAKGIFSVLSTDEQASHEFNKHAYAEVIESERQYADEVNSGGNVSSDNTHLTDAMTIKGLADSGIHTATDASGINDDLKNTAEYNTKKSAYDLAFDIVDAGGAPGTDLVSKTFEETLLGEQPKGEWQPHNMPHLNEGDAGSDVLNAFINRGVTVQQADLGNGLLAPADDGHPTPYVRSFSEYNEWAKENHAPQDFGTYKELINKSLTVTAGPAVPGIIDQQQNMASQYNAVIADPNAIQQPEPKK
jgi:hypothetical protein